VAKRVAIYTRVSTDRQTLENQRQALKGTAERRGWEVVAVYTDAGISGAKGRAERPGLDDMLKAASKGGFDVVMAWSIDRLFERSMIRQRVSAGLSRARAQGKRLGRPKVPSAVERQARRDLAKGTGILRVAKALGLGTGTVQRIKRAMVKDALPVQSKP
jgi:DNA invertase Pin-like site-specific DNA recombinase